MAALQDEHTHPELRKYTQVAQTIAGGAGGRIGNWLGLTAFSNPQSPPSKGQPQSQLLPKGQPYSQLLLIPLECPSTPFPTPTYPPQLDNRSWLKAVSLLPFYFPPACPLL